MSTSTKKQLNIVFLHPDLGIGGAERLVVDAAVGLQNLGHKVTIFTSHCDPTHCFDEARDGTLDVRVRGNTLFPPSILGRFAILCAILRQLHLVLQIAVFSSELRDLQPDAFFVDQLSACVPLLRITRARARILFYCHFPDKLLVRRGGWIKRAYRVPFDWLESWTTGGSDVIVVNSEFTREAFGEAFPGLRGRRPRVVYPCVDIGELGHSGVLEGNNGMERDSLWKNKKVVLSINRFEHKKDVGLAIRAFAGLDQKVREGTRLVIAGGYDPRMPENVSYHKKLDAIAESLGLKSATAKNLVTALSIPSDVDVLFLLSVPSSLKSTLLQAARLLIYTPGNEHFGIVPLEAMLARIPVLAADTGGPRETVVDGETGWLRSVEAVDQWTAVMDMVLRQMSEDELMAMGGAGRRRVVEQFSKEMMAQRLNDQIREMVKQMQRPRIWDVRLGGIVLVMGLILGIATATIFERFPNSVDRF